MAERRKLQYQPDSLLFKWKWEIIREECDECHGAGEVFTHADDCTDDLCALNGDVHSCLGQVLPCQCSATP